MRKRTPEELGERIGLGDNSSVYADKDASLVVKETRGNRESASFWKAQHYLMQIMRELFPESIPRQHAVHVTDHGRAQKIVERVDTSGDEEHERARLYQTASNDRRDEDVDLDDWNEVLKNIETRPQVLELIERFRQAGLYEAEAGIDMHGGNFVQGKNSDTAVYVDEFHPDSVNHEKLRAAIDALPEGASKNHALRCYRRMNELLEESKHS